MAATQSSPSGTADKDKSRFQLSAQMNERPQLSRQQLDPGSMKLAPTPPAATLSYAPPPKAVAPLREQSPSAAPDDADPRSFLKERNVPWASWVGQVADRWYYILRSHEESAGVQFVTQRAALFEFTCYADGRIGNISLKQSSGNEIYDHMQVIALLQTAPLPPFPAGTKRSSITLIQGWESHLRQTGEQDYVPGSFGRNFPSERVQEWGTAR